jgi:elongation factor Ts
MTMTTTQKAAVTAKEVQELRQRTGAGMMDSKRALEEAQGDMERAVDLLRKRGAAKAEKRMGKEAREGMVGHYLHHDGKLAVLVEVNCETDFVARNPEFHTLVRHIAEHIAAAAPTAIDKDGVPADRVERERRLFEEQVKESGKPAHLIDKIVTGKIESFYKDVALLHQRWVRDDKVAVGDLITEFSAKVGERIVVRRFTRYRVGEE